MQFTVDHYSREDWNELTGQFSGLNLLQRWEYGEAKIQVSRWRVDRGVFVDSGNIVAVAQILIQRPPLISKGGVAWVNRAPLCQTDGGGNGGDISRLGAAINALNQHYVQEQGMYLRIAPPLNDVGAEISRMNVAGMGQTENLGWASAVVDLTPSEVAIRSNLGAKWRGHLNKAERSEIVVPSGTGSDLFSTFLENHRKFIDDRGFSTSVTAEFLGHFQDACTEDHRMMVFMGYDKDIYLGSVLFARYGSTCEYLAGHSTEMGRKLGVNQLLIWQALMAMKDAGYKKLDVSGMDPVLTPKGIYDFKHGLGGTPYRLIPEMESTGGGLLTALVRWRVRRARQSA